ncbi:MAG: PHP domain-containing protein [Pseudomonadota bacterium]
MKIDLHIHSKDCSDGRMTLDAIFHEAHHRGIDVISITDHDSVDCQESAEILAINYGIFYIFGLELNVSFSHPNYKDGKPVSLDFLAYAYNKNHPPLIQKLNELREYRKKRAEKILEKLNEELVTERLTPFTHKDMEAIEETVDGAFGRPHIANYMVKKGLVSNKKEAFDRFLVKCDVPKMPVSLQDASVLVRGAGGKLMLAHPNDPNGTSLVSFTSSLEEQQWIIKTSMLPYIDGIECWHSRHDIRSVQSYLAFTKDVGLMVSGGSDCHQDPILMGSLDIPSFVVQQFGNV